LINHTTNKPFTKPNVFVSLNQQRELKMTYCLTAKNEIEAALQATRKFFANDRRTSQLGHTTTKGDVYACELVNGQVLVKRIR
jgi:hypothetical protein